MLLYFSCPDTTHPIDPDLADDQQSVRHFASFRSVIDMGAELSDAALDPSCSFYTLAYLPFFHKYRNKLADCELHPRHIQLIVCFYNNVLEVLHYGPLSQALISENEDNTISVLLNSPASVREISRIGETPLHVTAGWPRGIELMTQFAPEGIEAILDARDNIERTPLDFAIMLENPDAVELLLKLGPCADLEDTRKLESTLRHLRPIHSDAVIRLLSSQLAKQRRDLCQLALTSLAPSQITQYGIKRGHLVQNNAYEVAQAIQNCSVDFPNQYENIKPGSLFHSCMSANLAENLFQAGFDQPNMLLHGYSPLMSLDFEHVGFLRFFDGILNIVAWHLQHGADLHARLPDSSFVCASNHLAKRPGSFRVAHRVAYYIGLGLNYTWLRLNAIGRATRRDTLQMHASIIRNILADTNSDPCRCHCSGGGCTATSIFSRGVMLNIFKDSARVRTMHDYMFRSSERWRLSSADSSFLDETMDLITNIECGSDREPLDMWIISHILRVLTFERLGMKHTCCRYRSHWLNSANGGIAVTEAIQRNSRKVLDVMDRDEVRAIRDEDSEFELASTLNGLMEDFDLEFLQLGLPFSQFLERCWRPKMDDVDGPWKSRGS